MEKCWNSIDDDGDGYIDCADPDCFGEGIYGSEPQICTSSIWDTSGCVFGPGGNWSTLNNSNFPDQRNECQGPNDIIGNERFFHCNYGRLDDDALMPVGICCPEEKFAVYDTDTNTWRCKESDQCGMDASKPDPCLTPFEYFSNVADTDPVLNYMLPNRTTWLANKYSIPNDPTGCVTEFPVTATPPELQPYWEEKSTGCCLIDKYGILEYWYDESNIKIFGYDE